MKMVKPTINEEKNGFTSKKYHQNSLRKLIYVARDQNFLLAIQKNWNAKSKLYNTVKIFVKIMLATFFNQHL